MRLIIALLFCSLASSAQRLDHFAGIDDSGKKVGYAKIKSYYGFIDSLQTADAIVDGKKCYYLYFSLSDSLPDLGVRIFNPVPEMAMPDKGDFVSDNYYEHEKEKSGRFDTWLAIEHYEGMQNIYDVILPGVWGQLGYNDNSPEMPMNNSLLRLKNKKQPLLPGIYRIVISTPKDDRIVGGFLVQIGSMKSLHGVKITKSIAELTQH